MTVFKWERFCIVGGSSAYKLPLDKNMILILLICGVMWDFYIDISAVQWCIYAQCGRHVCSGAYVNNVKCTYTSVPGQILDWNDFK